MWQALGAWTLTSKILAPAITGLQCGGESNAGFPGKQSLSHTGVWAGMEREGRRENSKQREQPVQRPRSRRERDSCLHRRDQSSSSEESALRLHFKAPGCCLEIHNFIFECVLLKSNGTMEHALWTWTKAAMRSCLLPVLCDIKGPAHDPSPLNPRP